MRRIRILCVVLCLCICLMPCTALAASTLDANEPIVTTKDCSLTLNYVRGQKAFPNLKVRLYCVATVSSDLQYTLTDTFSDTGLTVNGITSASDWDTARTTLEGFIVSNRIEPLQEATTDQNGSVRFDGLIPGLYFVMPVRCTRNGVHYSFASVLVTVPSLREDGSWEYDVTVKPKSSAFVPTGEEEEHEVVKLWRDSGSQESRPESIEVDILRDGKVVETVVLSAENNWSYSWTAPDHGEQWQVVEQNVPEGYVMTVEEHSDSFTIINTVPDPSEPPYTGMTFDVGWYVMLLCISGLTLLILGATRRKNAEE